LLLDARKLSLEPLPYRPVVSDVKASELLELNSKHHLNNGGLVEFRQFLGGLNHVQAPSGRIAFDKSNP